MPRYIDLEELERRINEYVKMPRYASYEQRETADWCKDECIRQAYCMPTADVVPKSQYDLAVAEREANVKGFTEQIAKLIVEVSTLERDIKTAVKLIEGWQGFLGELKDTKIIKGVQPIEAITSVHMLTLEKYKDTNAPTKVSSHEICVACGEHVPEGRQICSMCRTGQEFLNKKE